jgi:hypothetical protein
MGSGRCGPRRVVETGSVGAERQVENGPMAGEVHLELLDSSREGRRDGRPAVLAGLAARQVEGSQALLVADEQQLTHWAAPRSSGLRASAALSASRIRTPLTSEKVGMRASASATLLLRAKTGTALRFRTAAEAATVDRIRVS